MPILTEVEPTLNNVGEQSVEKDEGRDPLIQLNKERLP